MYHYWWGFWWLIFPVGFFLFRAWDRWLSYRRSRHALDVMREYASQGKEPPAELAREVREDAYGYDDPRHLSRGRYRRRWRHGPYWEWRAAIWTGAVAAGFWLASEYSNFPGAEGPFRFVAIIMTCVAAANLVFALISSTRPRDR